MSATSISHLPSPSLPVVTTTCTRTVPSYMPGPTASAKVASPGPPPGRRRIRSFVFCNSSLLLPLPPLGVFFPLGGMSLPHRTMLQGKMLDFQPHFRAARRSKKCGAKPHPRAGAQSLSPDFPNWLPVIAWPCAACQQVTFRTIPSAWRAI